MKALRIVPFLLLLLFLVYLGVSFVEANQEAVVLSLGAYQTEPTRLGFVVMTSVLVGILIGVAMAGTQILFLIWHNRSLKKRVNQATTTAPISGSETQTSPDPDEPQDPGADTLLP